MSLVTCLNKYMRTFGLLIINIALTVKKINKKIFKLAKFYYLFIFWLRRRSIHQFDELVERKNVYYTIELHRSGFTDQLIQFVVIHNIGSALLLKFIHTDIYSARSFTENQTTEKKSERNYDYKDVYDFLGINNFLNDVSGKKFSKKNTKIVNYDLNDDSFFGKRGIAKKKYLAAYVKLDLLNLLDSSDEDILVNFRLKGHGSFYNIYNYSEDYYKCKYDFRELYENERQKKPLSMKVNSEAHTLFVHIRQGDTAVLRTPWNTFVLVWGRMKNAFKEFSSFEEIGNNIVLSVEVYHRFLNDLFRNIGKNIFSTIVFSDGYHRSFQKIYINKEKMNWSESKWEKMKSFETKYNDETFRIFSEFDNVIICIGEEIGKLYELIHSLLNAKVVIIGTQQKMIPKLLSIYCNPENMPLVIVLTNETYYSLSSFSRTELQPFFIRVNVNDYNMETIATIVNQFLQTRTQPGK